ncbi:putative FAD dependent oxidoreductase [Colletotrichum plurivorum]|uniref:Putative FAD dependent oxidoreductase n=1 Tax=Colletotrichum plurivorum TaxID=2175906 RepID=A0A8H6NFZ4_9PEZI|nr:putative FAD dependent oxidoreductase [Colletotrichum plurivorum]
MPPFKVIISGAGLAGTLLANGLLNASIPVTVYEREPAHVRREGFQVRLGEAAMEGFRACLRPDDLAAIRAAFSQATMGLTAPALCDTKFRTVLDLRRLPSYAGSWGVNRVVLREILLSLLKERGCVRFGRGVEGFEVREVDGRERVKVHLSDGGEDWCDVLIGADGSGSRINKLLGANNLVTIDSHASVLSKGPLPPDWQQKLPKRLLDGPVMVFGGDVALYYALFLPAADHAESSDGDKARCKVDEASFYWGLQVSKNRLPPGQSLDDIQDPLKLCLEATKDWAPEYHAMLTTGSEYKDKDVVTNLPLRASTTLPKDWRRKVEKSTGSEGHPRVWLIGDAIHAMQPTRGMGGNQAFRDCADALPRLIRLNDLTKGGVGPSAEDVSIACEEFESVMFERAFSWVRKSGGTHVPVSFVEAVLESLVLTVDQRLNFDGVLGTVVWIVGTTVVVGCKFAAKLWGLFTRSS